MGEFVRSAGALPDEGEPCLPEQPQELGPQPGNDARLFSRRKFLEIAARAAPALVDPLAPLTPLVHFFNALESHVGQNRYDRFRDKIAQADGDQAIKDQFHERIDQIEQTQSVLDRMMIHIRSNIDKSGKPRLVTLYEAKYRNLPLEEPLFVLRDYRSLQHLNGDIDYLLQADWRHVDQIIPHLPQLTLVVFPFQTNDFWLERRRITLDYREIGTEVPEHAISIETTTTPETQEAARVYNRDKQSIREFLEKMPRIRNIRVEIQGSDRYSLTPSAPNTRQNFQPASFFATDREDNFVINIDSFGITEWTRYQIYHLWAHAIDPLTNVYVKKKLTPEQFVDLITVLEQAQGSSDYGRNYPSLDRIFEAENHVLPRDGVPRAPLDFRKATGSYPDDVWASSRGPEVALVGNPPIGDVYFHAGWFAQAAGFRDFRQFLMYLKGFTDIPATVYVPTLASFLETFAPFINAIPWSYPEWASMFELLKKNRNLWSGNNPWYSRLSPSYYGETGQWGWWGYIYSVATNLLLGNALFAGNEYVIRNFTTEQLSAIINEAKTRFETSDQEKFAESIAYTMRFRQINDAVFGDNPYVQFLQVFSAVANP